MKQTTTLIASILFAIGISAQIVPGQVNSILIKAKYDKIPLSGDEALSHLIVQTNPYTSAVSSSKSAMTEEVIGKTTYDLQTNAAIQNRIIRHNGGAISATWTMSNAFSNSFLDRGTGYNYFDGTSWGDEPTSRLESSRGGWPSIIALGNGSECAITHNTDNSYINNTSRAQIGNGTWTENIATQDYLIWNRSVASGSDGNTIHMIALTEPSGGTWTGVPFNGVSGALLYFRSLDGGDTWDITDMQLPGTDSSSQVGMSGDAYSIAAEGNTVVVAYFDNWGDSFIIKSTSNGDSGTWNKTTFLDFPVDKYVIDDGLDLDNDDTLDYVYSTDGNGSIILDNNGDAHIFYGIMRYRDDNLADESFSYYPFTNGIAYWNESFGPDTTPQTVKDTSLWYSDMMNDHWIIQAPDLDGDGEVLGIDSTGTYANYGVGLASMTQAGIDAAGNIWLLFAGYTETLNNGEQVYRHLYITKSEDGGITWKTPVDITPHELPKECVFGSMVPEIDDKIRIIYQQDFEPGLSVSGDEDFIEENNIIYLEIDTAGLFDNTANNIIEFSNQDQVINENKIFDLLGREWKTNFSDLPRGIYIVNREKIFKF